MASSRRHAIACAAKASFSSTRSISIEREAGYLQDLPDGRHWSDAESLGFDARRGKRDEAPERRDAERACPLGGHDDDRGGTVARLRGIPRGHRALDVKCRLQFRECGDRSVAAWAFVDVERDGLRGQSGRGEAHFERDDLVRESPGIDGGDGLLMAGEREGVLFLAAHGRFAGVILGDEARASGRRPDSCRRGPGWAQSCVRPSARGSSTRCRRRR